MHINRLGIYLAMLSCMAWPLFLQAEEWTEEFSEGVGRLTLVSGQGDTVFVHQPSGVLGATFVRRSISEADPDRRLAELERNYTHIDQFAFTFEWMPVSGSLGSIPRFGLYSTDSLIPIVSLAVTDYRYQLEVGPGDFAVENVGALWSFNQWYRVGVNYDPFDRTIGVQHYEWEEGQWQQTLDRSWSVPDGVMFRADSIGIGNLVTDGGGGATMLADFNTIHFAGSTPLRGDMDGNLIVDAFDVDDFEMALSARSLYLANHPDINPDLFGDFDENGIMDSFDVDGFEEILAGGGASVPEPTSALALALGCLTIGMRRRC